MGKVELEKNHELEIKSLCEKLGFSARGLNRYFLQNLKIYFNREQNEWRIKKRQTVKDVMSANSDFDIDTIEVPISEEEALRIRKVVSFNYSEKTPESKFLD